MTPEFKNLLFNKKNVKNITNNIIFKKMLFKFPFYTENKTIKKITFSYYNLNDIFFFSCHLLFSNVKSINPNKI